MPKTKLHTKIASYKYKIITFGLDIEVTHIKTHPSIYESYISDV